MWEEWEGGGIMGFPKRDSVNFNNYILPLSRLAKSRNLVYLFKN